MAEEEDGRRWPLLFTCREEDVEAEMKDEDEDGVFSLTAEEEAVDC
jgi:hypothetical protein